MRTRVGNTCLVPTFSSKQTRLPHLIFHPSFYTAQYKKVLYYTISLLFNPTVAVSCIYIDFAFQVYIDPG